MRRRRFLQFAALAPAFAQQKPEPRVIAGATEDKTIRIGLVLSSFQDSEDHFGAKVKGLADPRPVDADLTDAQFAQMVGKALEFGAIGRRGLASIVEADDWVLIKTGQATDWRVVRNVVDYLLENHRGARISIAGSLSGRDSWGPEWRAMAALSRAAVKIELLDLDRQTSIALPVPGGTRSYTIPKPIQQCDRLISIAPLEVHPRLGASLTFGNYLALAPAAEGDPAGVAIDLFSYHPADYAILGGSWGQQEGGAVHHNVIVAGPNAVAVDAVAAAIMGFDPAALRALQLAGQRGFGDSDTTALWIRGNTIDEAKRQFKRNTAQLRSQDRL